MKYVHTGPKRSLHAKRDAQLVHARRRALDRFGLVLQENDLHAIVRDIQQGKAKKVADQSLRVGVYDYNLAVLDRMRTLAVTTQLMTVRIVYDQQRKTIVTFLTNDMGTDFDRSIAQ